MFSKSKIKRPNTCPISETKRLDLEKSFLNLVNLFGEESLKTRKVLIPNQTDFPIYYDGTEETAFYTLKIVAEQMNLEFDKIDLEIYDNTPKFINTGNRVGTSIFVHAEDNQAIPSGLYWGVGDDGKYKIGIGYSLLSQPENMVATLAHELAHAKLLGENRIEQNDEILTELTTVIFGLGIFNANSAFQTYRTNESHGWQSMGYLSQMEWGYALALFLFLRNEQSPNWIEHLTINIKGDFIQGQNFISVNENLIFQNK